MRRKASYTSLAAILLAALALAVPALAAAPKLPVRARLYSTGGYQSGVSVNLVINAKNPKIVQPGPAHLFGMFATGGIFVQCPTAPKSSRVTPLAAIPFPSFSLRRSHGQYVFSTSIRGAVTLLASSRTSPVAVTVALSGRVLTRTTIKGTVKISGAPCKRSATYTATLNRTARVEPGQ
jgi:hypothetical protein